MARRLPITLIALLTVSISTAGPAPQAQAWADAVAGAISNPQLLDRAFRSTETAHHLSALIATPTLKAEHKAGTQYVSGDNKAQGIIRTICEIEKAPHAAAGSKRIGSIQVFMPLRDSEGNEVFPAVKAALDKSMPKSWQRWHDPDDKSQDHYWMQPQDKAGIYIKADLWMGESSPEAEGTPDKGPWVRIFIRRLRGNSDE